MDNRINIINHHGQDVHYMDFRKLYLKDFIAHLFTCLNYIRNYGKDDMLLLFDVTDASVFGESLSEAKKFAKEIIPFRKKSALIGVHGAKKVLLNSILMISNSGDKVKAFNSMDEALDWLVS